VAFGIFMLFAVTLASVELGANRMSKLFGSRFARPPGLAENKPQATVTKVSISKPPRDSVLRLGMRR